MRSLRLLGGVDVAGERCDLTIRAGVVVDDAAPVDDTLDVAGAILAPGLIDLQLNGACGIDLTLEPERLWEVAAALPAYGVTAFAPTVVTSGEETRRRVTETLRSAPPPDWSGALPLGLHFEGPLLSPARKGAHAERWLTDPSTDLVSEWSRESGTLIVTLAPELPGAGEVIAELVRRGVVVSLGHTATDTAGVRAAIAAGARMVTHLGNAMPPQTAREPGLVGIALGGSDLIAGVIADGFHLDPMTLRTYWRALGPHRTLLVTDATAALGMPDGVIRLGDQHAEVRGGAVRLADGTLAGSAASLPSCLRTLIDTVDCNLSEAIGTCTSTAADLIGDATRGHLRPGARGDVTVLTPELEVLATIIGGRVAHHGEV